MEFTVKLRILVMILFPFFDKIRADVLLGVASTFKHTIDASRQWIKHINQEDLDIERILEKHALVCPPTNRCLTDGPNVFSPAGINAYTSPVTDMPSSVSFKECLICNCDQVCRSFKNCCPDSMYGYLDFDCVNVAMFPDGSEDFYYMIAHCPPDFSNQALAKECQYGDLKAVSSKDTKLAYRNSACASCYKEENLTAWNIAVKCLNTSGMTAFRRKSSESDFKRTLYENKCMVSQHLVDYDHPSMTPASCKPGGEGNDNIIDRCNVTGLWKSYDKQTDIACNYLEYRFLNFKNAFCFICNPGPLSLQGLKTIDSCNKTSRWDNYDAKVEALCLNMPAIGRLIPFKNVYCMLCNGIDTAKVSNSFQLVNVNVSIKELFKYSKEENNIFLDIGIDISVDGDNVFNDVRHILANAYGKKLTMYTPKQRQSNKTIAPVTKTLTFLKTLQQICGGAMLCLDSLTLLGYTGNETFGHNDFCENCRCDSSCAEDKRCCQDILFRKRPYSCFDSEYVLTLPPDNRLGASAETLHKTDKFNKSFLVIDTCLNTQNTTLVNLCQGINGISDELSFIPITIRSDNNYVRKIAYKNSYCLQCNVGKPSQVVISLRVFCDNFLDMFLFTDFSKLMSQMSRNCETAFVLKHSELCLENQMELYDDFYYRKPMKIRNVHLDWSLRQMLTELYGNETLDKDFTSCNQSGNWDGKEQMLQEICEVDSTDQSLLALPKYRIHKIRYFNFACFACNPDAAATDMQLQTPISQCNLTGSWDILDNVTVDLCQRNDEVSYWMPFKNLYCSKCNHGSVSRYGLKGGSSHQHLVYRLLFALSDHDWNLLKKVPDDVICVNGTLDHSTRSCRKLYCELEEYFLFDRLCRPLVLNAAMLVFEVSLYFNKHPDCYSLVYPTTFSSNCPMNFPTEIFISFYDVFQAIRARIEDGLDNTTWGTFYSFTGDSYSECIEGDRISVINLKNVHVEIHMFVFSTENFIHVLEALIKAQTDSYEIISDSGSPIKLFATAKRQHDDQTQIETSQSRCMVRNTEIISIPGHIDPKDDLIVYNAIIVSKFLICPQVQISQDEFRKSNTSNDVRIIRTDAVLLPGDYFETDDGHLRICLDTYEDKVMSLKSDRDLKKNRQNKLSFPYYVFSLICTVLSLICLLVTFIVYCTLQQLRTVPGQNNMVLCFCLFFAQLILQFGLHLNTNVYLCATMGILIHFFWLSTFCAMNICAYHMCNVFCVNQLQAHVSVSRLRYRVYTFGTPFLIVGTSVLVHLLLSDTASCGYGPSLCFLSDFTSIIVTFCVPSVIIFASNITFFGMTFFKIRSRPAVQSSANRNDLFICIKLSTIIGFAWPLQFVDSFFELSIFSFFVVTVNALQGVSIFLSYICNARVASLLRVKLLGYPRLASTTGNEEFMLRRVRGLPLNKLRRGVL